MIYNPLNTPSKKFPVIKDTTTYEGTYAVFYTPRTAWYTTLYRGPIKDTIDVYYEVSPWPEPEIAPLTPKEQVELAFEEVFNLYSLLATKYKSWDSTNLEVLVDTSLRVLNFDFSNFALSINAYKSYPVALINHSKDTIIAGYGVCLPIILEAMNTSGYWKEAEKELYHPGTEEKGIILPGGQMILTSVPIYQGSFKTRLRLKIGQNYSNEFYGYINPGQLRQK